MTQPLRPVIASDAPAVLEAFRSAPDMARQGEVTTLDEAEAYVARLLASERPHHTFAVDADDRLVGMVGITLDVGNRSGWFWYWIHAAHRGGGLMTSAARAAADWALAEGGCDRLELGHRVNNPASARVAQTAGFVLEGREREKFLVDGERIDVLTYGRLRSDPVPPRSQLLKNPLTAAPAPAFGGEAALP